MQDSTPLEVINACKTIHLKQVEFNGIDVVSDLNEFYDILMCPCTCYRTLSDMPFDPHVSSTHDELAPNTMRSMPCNCVTYVGLDAADYATIEITIKTSQAEQITFTMRASIRKHLHMKNLCTIT